MRERNNIRIKALRRELASLSRLFGNTSETLKSYYAKDIIFFKYRNLVAISSFYEYFCSGRCTCLEGHEGAYNIFENELRQNIIIYKLDEVIERLDKIEENQAMLYAAIKEGNRKADSICKEINETVNKMEQIESNTSVIAYNSDITAQNTECIKWLEFFRN